jgi:hypothetical protein
VVLGDRSDLSIAYQGGGSDQVVLAYGSRSPSRLVFGIRGPVLLKGDPYVALFELGTATGAGALQTALPMPDVASGSGSLRPIVQILSGSGTGDPTGRWTPGDAASLLLLDRDPGPDCDGDGLNDLVELIEHPERDANHNLIPDACPGG